MKILHIASFTGNIGDNININGIRNMLEKQFNGSVIEYTNIEIRDYYLNGTKQFDYKLIDKINEHDLIIIGGGSFFDLCYNNTLSGCTVGFSADMYKKIKPLVILYALGCKKDLGLDIVSVKKFTKLITEINTLNNVVVSVRNDGTYDTFASFLPQNLMENIFEIPDNGIFYKYVDLKLNLGFKNTRKNIGVTLAGDLISSYRSNGILTKDEILEEYIKFFNSVLENFNIICFVHVIADLEYYQKILKCVDNKHIRENIIVTQYNTQLNSEHILSNYYNICDVIISSRFHGNILGLALNKPTIGLFNLETVLNIFKKMKLDDMIIDVKNKEFSEDILILINDILKNYKYYQNNVYNSKLTLIKDIEYFYKKITNKTKEIK